MITKDKLIAPPDTPQINAHDNYIAVTQDTNNTKRIDSINRERISPYHVRTSDPTPLATQTSKKHTSPQLKSHCKDIYSMYKNAPRHSHTKQAKMIQQQKTRCNTTDNFIYDVYCKKHRQKITSPQRHYITTT